MRAQNGWPEILGKLLSGESLQRDETHWAMRQIMSGSASEGQLGAFMIALRAKGETVEELSGLVDVMLENSVILDTGPDAVDIVGTGGDLVGTVNISTMASILTAAQGLPVLKHGSRSASGKTGSSEVLEVMGIRLDLSPAQVADVFRETGITFFFAPVFHPAMRHVAPVRKQLGIPTTFNFLGPLANPAQPIATALGVASEKGAPLMAGEFAARERTGLVFRGKDGLDELTTTGSSQVWEISRGQVRDFAFDPGELRIQRSAVSELLGGDARENAEIALRVLAGEDSGRFARIADIVALNSAAGVVAYALAKNPHEAENSFRDRMASAYQSSRETLRQGLALQKFEEWSASTQRIAG
jgi:anthranilate phosphoribosyltransferase